MLCARLREQGGFAMEAIALYYATFSRNAYVPESLSNYFRSIGITLQCADGRPPQLLFFDRPSEELCDCLQQFAGDDDKRIIAIALSEEALHGPCSWQLLAAGASEVLIWRGDPTIATMIIERLDRWRIIDEIVDAPNFQNNLAGRSRLWIRVLRRIVEVAHYTTASVLITGESGTGKELIARLIHKLDQRTDKHDFVILDCATVVPDLSGSEFFGHERGAFTNAISSRDGVFALADKGTLFLDEVGELPLSLQAELLRVVQERTYKRVGGNDWKQIDFRLVCATNRDLLQEEMHGRFRRDLYHRIAAFACALPPLREHREDIIPLAKCFWCQLRPDESEPQFDPTVRDFLMTRDYPGNVRDLKHLVTRISHRHVGTGAVTVGDIPEDDRPAAASDLNDWRDPPFEQALRRALALGMGLKEIGRATEETAERIAIADEDGNLQRAARKLGVTDRALQMRRANRRLKIQTED